MSNYNHYVSEMAVDQGFCSLGDDWGLINNSKEFVVGSKPVACYSRKNDSADCFRWFESHAPVFLWYPDN